MYRMKLGCTEAKDLCSSLLVCVGFPAVREGDREN